MSRTATYFADSEIIEYYQKHVAEKAREYQSKIFKLQKERNFQTTYCELLHPCFGFVY